jgi:hypothetical protein
MEGLIEGFLRTLDGEQFNKILQSGIFSPVQMAGLVEIMKFAMEREEADRKAAEAAGGANGANGAASHGSVAGQPPPQPAAT